LFLKDGKCETDCGINYTLVDKECVKCTDKKCNLCSIGNPNNCVDCLPYKRLEGQCIQECPPGTHYDLKSHECINCSENCVKCNDVSKCEKCNHDLFIQDGKCVERCKDGYTIDMETKICVKCKDSKCKKCFTNPDKCDICQDDRILHEGKCVESCPSDYFVNTFDENKIRTCEKCLCKTCIDIDRCTSCDDDKVLFENKCLPECPDKLYAKINVTTLVKECVPCPDPSCLRCSKDDINQCTLCTEGKKLFYNKNPYRIICKDSCEDGTFQEEIKKDVFLPNETKVKCEECTAPCLRCESSTNCNKCPDQFVLNDGKCESRCPEGFTENNEKRCVRCSDLNCSKCLFDNLNNCLECKEGKLMLNGQCVNECPEGHRESVDAYGKKICVACPNNCLQCDPNNCTKCKENMFYVESNNGECGPCSEVDVIVDTHCKKCEPQRCISCIPGNSKRCKECSKDTINVDGECKVDCSEGFFKSVTDGNTTCERCNYKCKTCESLDECLICNDPKAVLTEDGQCLSECPNNQTIISGKCVPCQVKDCKTCDPKDLKICVDCPEDHYLFENKCLPDCEPGTRKSLDKINDKIVRICVRCPTGCSDCNENHCNKCDNEKGFKMQNGICVQNCQVGYYEKVIEVKGVKTTVCLRCSDTNCEKCDAEKCSKCSSDAIEYIIDGYLTCVNECPEKTYLDTAEKKCKQCSNNCKNCTSDQNCKECVSDYILLDSKTCVEECPEGLTLVNNNQTNGISVCEKCTDANCLVCHMNDPSKCAVCKSPDENGNILILDQLTLTCKVAEECKDGLFRDIETGDCLPCKPECPTCSDIETCLSCKDGKPPVDGNCETSCPVNSVEVDDICVNCTDINCLKCADNLDTCFECKEPLILYKGKCHNVCPDGSYKNTEVGECKTCPYNCKTCEDDKNCNTCAPSFFLFNNDCVNPCPDNYFENCNKCEKCHESCSKCKGNTENDCIKCANDFYKFEDNCKFICPNGYFKVETPEKKCEKCNIKNCLKCDKADSCSKCRAGYFFNEDLKECVRANLSINLINENLFSNFNNKESKMDFNLIYDANSVGIRHSEVAFTFWLRIIADVHRREEGQLLDIFTLYTYKEGVTVQFGINHRGDCFILFNDQPNNISETSFIRGGCSIESLYNFRHMGLVSSIEDKWMTLTLYYENDNKKFISSSIKLKTVNEYLITVDSHIRFDSYYENSVFQVNSFTIREYNPFTSSTYDDLINLKPQVCDYNCENCRNDKCLKCVGSVSLVNDNISYPTDFCPASYVNVYPHSKFIIGSLNVSIRNILEEKLIQKNIYVSHNYAFGGWINIGNSNEFLNDLRPIKYLKSEYVKKDNEIIEILNLEIKINKLLLNNMAVDITPIKEDSYYFLLVAVSKETITIWTSTISTDFEMKTEIKNHGVGRFFNDIDLNIAKTEDIRSLFETRFYFNNIPEDSVVREHIASLKMTDNCTEYNEYGKCVKCKENYVVRNNVCEASDKIYILSSSVINIAEDESREINVEKYVNEDVDKKFSVSFFIKRKNLSIRVKGDYEEYDKDGFESAKNLKNAFSIFSIFDMYDKNYNFVSIRYNHINLNTEYLFKISENDYFRVIYENKEDQPFSFMKIIISLDFVSKEVNYFYGDNTRGLTMRMIKGSINDFDVYPSFLKFGDVSGTDMNIEIVNPKFQSQFYNNEKEDVIKLYRDPNLCGFGCTECDFESEDEVNVCKTCYNNQKNMTCSSNLLGFINIQQWENMDNHSRDLLKVDNDITEDDHYRLYKMRLDSNIGIFDERTNLESTSDSYSVTGTVLFYEDRYVDNEVEFNIFALSEFRKNTSFNSKDKMDVVALNFLRLDVVRKSVDKLNAIVRMKSDYDNSTTEEVNDIEIDINKWTTFYIKISKDTMKIIFEYPDKDVNYNRFYEKTITLKKQPVNVTEMTSIVKNFGKYHTNVNMASLYIYLIPNDNKDDLFEKSKKKITGNYKHFEYEKCDENCRVCSQLFHDPDMQNVCLECDKYNSKKKEIFLVDGKCIKKSQNQLFSYKLLLNSFLETTASYPIPLENTFINKNNLYFITFYLRRNYLPDNFSEKSKFFGFGNISMKISSDVRGDTLFIDIPEDLNHLPFLTISHEFAQEWYSITLIISKGLCSIKVGRFGLSEVTYIEKLDYKLKNLNILSLLGSNIEIDNLNDRISIHTLRMDVSELAPKLNRYPMNDYYAQYFWGASKSHYTSESNFFLINNKYEKEYTKQFVDNPRIELNKDNVPYRISLSSYINPPGKLLITEFFRISFDLRMDPKNPSNISFISQNKLVNILKLNNNIDTQYYNEKREHSITNIISIFRKDKTTFVVKLGNKLKFYTNNEIHQEIVLKLKVQQTNSYLKFYVSKVQSINEDRYIQFLIYDNPQNYAYEEVMLKKKNKDHTNYDMITNHSSFYFFDDEKSSQANLLEDYNIEIKDLIIKTTTKDSFNTVNKLINLRALLSNIRRKTQRVQDICQNDDETCEKCTIGVLQDGICLPDNNSVLLITNQAPEYLLLTNNSTEGNLKNISLKNNSDNEKMTKFSFSFNFKRFDFSGILDIPLVNIYNNGKVIFSLILNEREIYFINHLVPGYKDIKNSLANFPRFTDDDNFKPYLLPLREYYVVVSVDLKEKYDLVKIFSYTYNSKYQNTDYLESTSGKVKYPNNTDLPSSIIPNNLQYSIGLDENQKTRKNIDSFVHSFIFNPNYLLPMNKEINYRVRFSNICNIPCKVSCEKTGGICPNNQLFDKEYDISNEKYAIYKNLKNTDIDYYSNLPLFRAIKSNDNEITYPTHTNMFLISLSVSITDFENKVKNKYTNKDDLLILTKDRVLTEGLMLDDKIPLETNERSILSIGLDMCLDKKVCDKKLIIGSGYSNEQYNRKVKEIYLYSDITFETLSVYIYMENEINSDNMVESPENNTIDKKLLVLIKQNNKYSMHNIEFDGVSSLLSTETLVYNHPSVIKSNLDIVSPNIEEVFYLDLKNTNLHDNMNNLCSNVEHDDNVYCEACIENVCLKCSDNSFLNDKGECKKSANEIIKRNTNKGDK